MERSSFNIIFRLQEFQRLNLKLDRWRFVEALRQTGMPSELLPYKEILEKCHPTYTFVVITNCEELGSIICNRLLLNELVMSSGAQLGLESPDVLGMKRGFRHTLRIPAQNGGAVIEVRSMLFLMNFEETYLSPICFDGSIDILSLSRLKEEPCLLQQQPSGLRQTSTRSTGTQT